MKFLFSLVLIIGGICGAAIGFLSNIVVSSPLTIVDGMELSLALGLFSVVIMINGICNLFSTD